MNFDNLLRQKWVEMKSEVVSYHNFPGIPTEAMERLNRSLEVNVPGGKMLRGKAVIDTALGTIQRELSEQEISDICTLYWLVEIFQAYLLIFDDIGDHSEERRGRKAWHCQPGVGNGAVHDASVLSFSIFRVLKIHFHDHPAYTDMIEIFNDSSLNSAIGQSTDCLLAYLGPGSIESFTEEKWKQVTCYVAGWSTFYLSVGLTLHYFGLGTPSNLAQAKGILFPIAEYYQAQNCFRDSFASSDNTGKAMDDIRGNKCSWLAVQAFKSASQEQRKLLVECYGRSDGKSEARVMALYKELGLFQVYETYQSSIVNEIEALVDGIDGKDGLRPDPFRSLLQSVRAVTQS